ncbi:MAG: FliM/FliN family flagellar motor switch protein [Phycisphaerae bacterium]|nr:FliM/FliN family flagellar motor switch protein [Phycisphaerae bacterium]
MTDALTDSLGRERIRQLLAAVGSAPAQDQTVGKAQPYDWRDPHWLTADQVNCLAAVMSQVAAKLANVFTRYFSHKVEVSPTAVTQHFANDLPRLISMDRVHCLTFGPDDRSLCGFLAVSSPTTMDWVTRLLGDAEAAGDPDRPLSSLEESLVCDLVLAATDAFLASLRPHETLKSSERFQKGRPSVQFEPTEEICRIAFQVKEADKGEPHEITFVLSCSRLGALVGRTSSPAPRTTPQELSKTLMEHLQQMPVTVAVRLATAQIGFREVMGLAPGDILLLDKPIHEMVELVVEGRTAFCGRPVQSDGQYAIVIKESQAIHAQETPKPKTPGEPKKG